MDHMEIQNIIEKYHVQLYASKFNDLDEIHQLLKRYHLPKLTRRDDLNTTVSMLRQ